MLLSRLERLGRTSWGGSGGSRRGPALSRGLTLELGLTGGLPRAVGGSGSKPAPLFLLKGEKGTGIMNRFLEKVANKPAGALPHGKFPGWSVIA